MISAFGALAQGYARGLGDLDAIVAEVGELPHAYLEAVRRRERGETFYGMVLLDDPRWTYTYRRASLVATGVADYDLQFVALDQLASGTVTIDGKAASEHWEIGPDLRYLVSDFYGLCDAMLVRSYAEYQRIAELLVRAPRPVERVLVEPALPLVERTRPERPGVVVWAARRPAVETTLHAFGLRELIGDLLFVTAGGMPRPNLAQATFVEPGDPRIAAALATAAAVLCVEPSDPGDAVAFARRGYGVVAPRSAGAHEFAGDVVTWDANASSLQHAVATALARPAAVRGPDAQVPRAPVRPPAPLPRAELPLVSVLCPTYNRPHDLRGMLTAMAAQSYPNVEVVVVNDGGSPVHDVVAEFPFARLVEHAANQGAMRATQTAYENARGAYVQLTADDDVLFPDHLERVMYALLRSGAAIAHGAGLSRVVERAPDGSWTTRGLSCVTFSGTATPSEALVAVPVCYNQVVQQRRVFAEVGWFRNDISLCDQEMLLRLAQRYTFVYVDHITSEFRDHVGGRGKTFDHLAEQRLMYDEMHPVPGRPVIAERRVLALEGVARRTPGQPAFTPVLRIGGPIADT